MLKRSFLLLVLVLGLTTANAQVINKGDLGLNLGLGFGWNYHSGYSNYNYAPFPSINFSAEYGAIETGEVGLITFGGLASYRYSPYKDNGFNHHYTTYSILARATFHLQFFDVESWDFYAGLETGFGSYRYTYKNSAGKSTYSDSYYIFGEFLGARYMFADNVGVFAELGNGGTSYTKIGFTWIF